MIAKLTVPRASVISSYRYSMLVYGVRCSTIDLADLPSDATADFYVDYGLLVFPSYTKTLCLQGHGTLNSRFWRQVQRIVQHAGSVSAMDFEDPWITDDEAAVVTALKEAYPGIEAGWYYVPVVAGH